MICLEDKKIINKFAFRCKYQEAELGCEFKNFNREPVRCMEIYFILFMVALHLQEVD
jgi:hypothetical protein